MYLTWVTAHNLIGWSQGVVWVYPHLGFPGSASGKELVFQCRRHKRHGFDPWLRKIPWRTAWQPSSVFLPGESHGQRSLVVYGPQDCRDGHNWSDFACIHASSFGGLTRERSLAKLLGRIHFLAVVWQSPIFFFFFFFCLLNDSWYYVLVVSHCSIPVVCFWLRCLVLLQQMKTKPIPCIWWEQ